MLSPASHGAVPIVSETAFRHVLAFGSAPPIAASSAMAPFAGFETRST